MVEYYATEEAAKLDIPKAREAMAFSERDTFKVEQLTMFGKTYPYTIGMYRNVPDTRETFQGYY